jgi:hypothetical protein
MALRDSSLTVSGRVFLAKNVGLEKETLEPPAYQLLPIPGEVSASWASGSIKAPIKAGQYILENLPMKAILTLEASASGVSPRKIVTFLYGDAIVDFKADRGRASGPYLVDAPELLSVEAGVGKAKLGSTLRLTYSEPLDPNSLKEGSIGLEVEAEVSTSSREVIGGLRLVSPQIVALDTYKSLAAFGIRSFSELKLFYGKGVLKETAKGNVLGGEPKTVWGYSFGLNPEGDFVNLGDNL